MWRRASVVVDSTVPAVWGPAEQVGLKVKQWVRLKRGLYKDDIAQVDYVDLAQNQVHLKLLPRIDYTRMRGALRTTATVSQLAIIKEILEAKHLKSSRRVTIASARRNVARQLNLLIQRQ